MIAEGINVVVVVEQIAEGMLGPAWRFIPVFARYDIQLAVAVDIGEGASLIGAQVDFVLLERDLRRTSEGISQYACAGYQTEKCNGKSHGPIV